MMPATSRWRSLDLPLALILLAAGLLRLVNLEYSHFQGDEVKALFPAGAAFPGFLFEQRKGPIQFVVTLGVRLTTGGYEEWVTRLPFALASLLAVYVMYRLVRDEFGRYPALLAAALLGSCGLLTAFGRIAQYQSFLVLFVLAAAYFLLQWRRDGRPRSLYFGSGYYALALLTHYDALVFAPSAAILVLAGLRRHAGGAQPQLRHLLAAVTGAALLLAAFYVPYLLHPSFPAVKEYLLSRVASGSGLRPFAATRDLLGLYLPPFYLAITIPLLGAGIVRVCGPRRTFSGLLVLCWYASAFTFYMLLGGDPRSHVYNYFIPGFVLVALGIETIVGFARRRPVRLALQFSAWLLIAGSGAMTYSMLVDHSVEHPWTVKRVFGHTLPNLETRTIDGVFGFPYRRGLEQAGELFRSGRLRGTFDSNERDAMADYYFHARRGSPPDYYIHVPRSLSLRRERPAYLSTGYSRIAAISVNGRDTLEVYAAPGRSGGR